MFMKVQVSSIWKKKKMIRKTVGFEPTTQVVQLGLVYYANHWTTEVLLDSGEIIEVHIASTPTPKKNLTSFGTVFNPNL